MSNLTLSVLHDSDKLHDVGVGPGHSCCIEVLLYAVTSRPTTQVGTFRITPVHFSSPEPLGSQGGLIVYPSSRRPSSVRPPFSKIFSETAWPVNAKFYVEPPCEGCTSLYKWSRSYDQDGHHTHLW